MDGSDESHCMNDRPGMTVRRSKPALDIGPSRLFKLYIYASGHSLCCRCPAAYQKSQEKWTSFGRLEGSCLLLYMHSRPPHGGMHDFSIASFPCYVNGFCRSSSHTPQTKPSTPEKSKNPQSSSQNIYACQLCVYTHHSQNSLPARNPYHNTTCAPIPPPTNQSLSSHSPILTLAFVFASSFNVPPRASRTASAPVPLISQTTGKRGVVDWPGGTAKGNS